MPESPDFVPYGNRWLIPGVLTTETYLHIGAGAPETRSDLAVEDTRGRARAVKYGAIFKDHQGNPCLPGASIKGVMRAVLLEAFGSEAIEELLGTDMREDQSDKRQGGKLVFHDAFLIRPGQPRAKPPFWNEKAGTGLVATVAIDRRTGTASDRKLAHHEVVAPGAQFELCISGQNLSDDEVARLLWALERFNDRKLPLRLGKNTVHGWGRCRFELKEIQCLEKHGVAAWVRSSTRKAGWRALEAQPLDSQRRTALGEKVRALSGAERNGKDCLTFQVALHFDGPFLVRENGPEPERKEGESTPAEPRLTPDGHVLLPERSVRGVLRSRAERILRTLARQPNRLAPDPTASQPEDFSGAELGESEADLGERLEELSAASRVFGAGGWRSVVDISDFVSTFPARRVSDPAQGVPSKGEAERERYVPLVVQEFVAVDRFTGGAAQDRDADDDPHGKKFSIRATWHGVLCGTITLRLDRCRFARTHDWAPGLLALVLRDVLEGDLNFGASASKGYGACTASFNYWDGDQQCLQPDSASNKWWEQQAGSFVENFHRFLDQQNQISPNPTAP